MVASLRCGELKDEALNLVNTKIHSFKEKCEKTILFDFQ